MFLDKIQATNRILSNNRGFAIVETIVSLAILSVVLVGLMTMVQYARVRAVASYHDRYVLLRVDAELQKIRYFNSAGFDRHDFGMLLPVTFRIPQITQYRGVTGPEVTIRFTRDIHSDFTVSLDTWYHVIEATAEWDERVPRIGRRTVRPERRSITLREDYFFRRVGMGT
jgi:hypothetical protein